MGRGIAQWAAVAGHTVELCDVRTEAVTEAAGFVRSMLERAVQKGRMTADGAAAAVARLVPLEDPWAAGPEVELVIEAVREDLATKAEVFGLLERALPGSAVFATNTSSLSVTRIAATLKDPARLAGLHFFNPVPLMRIVEVVPGAATRPDIPPLLTELVESCGHRAVTVADTPGFLINHAGRGLVTEALALLEENVSDPAGIDRIARDVLGLRMGPFELMDLTGLDVTAAVIDSIWEGFRHEDRLRPSYLTPNRVTAGLLGRKTGRGWFAYGSEAPAPAVEAPVTGDADRPVHVFAAAHGDRDAAALREALSGAGATVESGPRPSAGALVLVPVWGTTVASAVTAHRLPAGRTFGVDPLPAAGRRRVLAVTPPRTGGRAGRPRGTGTGGGRRAVRGLRGAGHGGHGRAAAARLHRVGLCVHRGARAGGPGRYRSGRHHRSRLPGRAARLGRPDRRGPDAGAAPGPVRDDRRPAPPPDPLGHRTRRARPGPDGPGHLPGAVPRERGGRAGDGVTERGRRRRA